MTARLWQRLTQRSSPSRGTWIEISGALSLSAAGSVVPLAGDVDRNIKVTSPCHDAAKSSPSRGTWIEIVIASICRLYNVVVPPAGDGGRNLVM